MVTNFGCTGLLIVFIAAFPLEAEQSCQNSTKRKEPHCDDILSIGNDTFQIFADIRLQGEWEEAQTYCECVYKEFDIVGRLAVLSNNSVFEEVRGYLMNDSIYTSADCVRGYWIGCTNNDTNNFTWIDGTHLATDDPVWFPGQPNENIAKCAPQTSNQKRSCPNVCCQMWIKNFNDSNLKIDDAKCNLKNKFFICQFPNGTQFDYFQNCSETRLPHEPKSCPTDSTSNEKGVINWPDTKVKTTSEMRCPYGKDSTAKAERQCKCNVRSPRAEWDPPDTSACTTQSRGERLNDLANTTISPGQAKEVAEILANITSEADDFEENDVTLSVDVIDNILESGANGTEIEVAEDVLMSVDNLLHVDHGVLVASQQNENTVSRLIESVEKLSLIVQFINESMDSGNQSVAIETGNIALILAEIHSESFVGLNFRFSSGKTELSRRTGPVDVIEETESSIHLPISLLDGLEPDERSQVNRVQFVVHKLNTFFKAVDMNGTQAQFSPVIAASIGELKITNLRDPVRIQIPRNNQVVNSTLYNVSCAFWNYSLSGK